MNRPEAIQRVLATTRTDELYRIRRLGLSDAPMAIKIGERYIQYPEHLAPFLNAMHLGFETSEMAVMVKELGFELAWLDPTLEELPWLQGYRVQPMHPSTTSISCKNGVGILSGPRGV